MAADIVIVVLDAIVSPRFNADLASKQYRFRPGSVSTCAFIQQLPFYYRS
ncbi:MAG: hypothetical protein ACJAU5_000893 [Maricaulis maris]|jgi:hypothetical protein|nr:MULTISPECIES: hypothetical protein [Maricaulis]